MKIFIMIIAIAFLFIPAQNFSQSEIEHNLIPEKLLRKGVDSNVKPNEPFKQKHEQIKQRLNSNNFSNSESEKIISKK